VVDVVVNSLFEPETGHVAAFEELIGCHGGVGGPQAASARSGGVYQIKSTRATGPERQSLESVPEASRMSESDRQGPATAGARHRESVGKSGCHGACAIARWASESS
jgi:hypothetical protein